MKLAVVTAAEQIAIDKVRHEVDSLRLDERLLRAGYGIEGIKRRRARARQLQRERNREPLRRGPWLGGAWAANRVRVVD